MSRQENDQHMGINKKRQDLSKYRFSPRFIEQGKVVSVGDGIVWVVGLSSAAIDEILIFKDGSQAVIFHLTKELIGGILIKQTDQLTAGTTVKHYSGNLKIKTGDNLLGRIIDPLGKPLDGLDWPELDSERNLDSSSPPIIARDFVNQPIVTGNRIVDSLIPIGKGQRQLLIGDNGLGKSSIAIDIVASQKYTGVVSVYVLIGQNRSSVLSVIKMLKDNDALKHSVVVVAEASSLPGLQYLAPFSGCAIAEQWMQQGRHTLVVFDDLTAHANCYRELSLLLRRPPGREAFPADIFFLHSRLLERATCLGAKFGGGTMTALPIIETKEGEIASYIPTNLISITDGQIYFDSKLFSSGFLPAIDITRSVSRVGGSAQYREIKREAGRMKLDYLQFLELESFTRFGAKLEEGMRKKIKKGRILREIFKQERLKPTKMKQQLAWLIAYNNGLFDELDIDKIAPLVTNLFNWIETKNLNIQDDRKVWSMALDNWTKEFIDS